MLKKGVVAAVIAAFSIEAMASLTDLDYAIELETEAAIANQAVYDELKNLPNGCGDLQETGNPSDPLFDSANSSCTGATYIVWTNVRELVHTANEILNNGGPIEYSLDADVDGLGRVLRWTASEEYGTQESLADTFLQGQLTSLKARVNAIKAGSSGFSIALAPHPSPSNDDGEWQYGGVVSGLAAGDKSTAWSKLGGFLNYTYGWGDQEPNNNEPAYEFDNEGINAGIDYRADDHWVLGVTLSLQYDRTRFEFDPKTSIAIGGTDMDAWSIIPFALYQEDNWYSLISFGYQDISYESERRIQYGSNDLDGNTTDTTAVSDSDASTTSLSINGGYTWRAGFDPKLSLEPSLGLNYQKTTIDKFKEKDLKNDGFNFIVDEQNIDSLQTIISLKLQRIFTPSWGGVIAPFFDAALYSEHEKDERTIDVEYAETANQINVASFSVTMTPPEDNYTVYTLGASFVIRGARQTSADGPATGGIQGFISISDVQGITGREQTIATGGMRYEF